jgi:hypothetical protein
LPRSPEKMLKIISHLKEIKTKTTMSNHLYFHQGNYTKRQTRPCGNEEPSYIADEKIDGTVTSGKMIYQFPKKPNLELIIWSATLILSIYPREMKISTQINRIWYTHIMEYYSDIE